MPTLYQKVHYFAILLIEKQIERDAPLVSFALGVSDYGDAVLIDIAAKNVDIKPKQYRQRIKELGWLRHDGHPMQFTIDRGKLFKSTLNNRLCSNLACVIDESSRGVKLKRAFEELPEVT